jgi:hypothetical protein
MYQSIWKAIEEFPDAIIDIMKDGAEVMDKHYRTKLNLYASLTYLRSSGVPKINAFNCPTVG